MLRVIFGFGSWITTGASLMVGENGGRDLSAQLAGYFKIPSEIFPSLDKKTAKEDSWNTETGWLRKIVLNETKVVTRGDR
jgi:hypothetical protein